jgi:phage terminase large subunit
MVGEVRSTQGDGFIIFQGMQDHTADSVKGLEGIDIVWAEEAQNLSQRSIDLLLPTIRKPGSEIWFSWNPDQPENPVDRFFRGESGLPDGTILVNVNYTDNPFISEEAIALANTARKQDMQAYLHIWMGHYNIKSDAQILNGKWFVDEFSPYEPTVNGDVQVKAGWDGPYLGADFGFAQDPTVLIKLWIHDRCLHVERESYAVGLELDHTADRWKLDIPDCHLYTVRADNARPESISYLKRHGIPKIVAVSKGAGSVEDGIAHLRSYDKIIIHPRCKNTIEEARLYSYKVDRLTGDVLPIVVDAHNHCLAAGTLITTDKGDRPIEEIQVGEKVLTRAGFKRVLWSGATDSNRTVFTVKTKFGKQFEATENHEILTQRGFVRVDALRYNDKVLTLEANELCPEEQPTKERKSHTKDLFTRDTPIQNAETIASITSQQQRILQDMNGICTDKSGLAILEQFQKGIISITKMATQTTTISKILSVFLSPSICRIMRVNGFKKTKSSSLPILIAFDRSQGSGTPQKKAKNFTQNWLRISQKRTECQLKEFAIAAANHLNQTHAALNLDSAQTLASQNGEEIAELMTSTLYAQFAASLLEQTNTPKLKLVADRVQIVSSTRVAEKVYDLTIEDQHEFFANGVLVHNCLDSARYGLEPLIRNTSTAIRRSGIQLY